VTAEEAALADAAGMEYSTWRISDHSPLRTLADGGVVTDIVRGEPTVQLDATTLALQGKCVRSPSGDGRTAATGAGAGAGSPLGDAADGASVGGVAMSAMGDSPSIARKSSDGAMRGRSGSSNGLSVASPSKRALVTAPVLMSFIVDTCVSPCRPLCVCDACCVTAAAVGVARVCAGGSAEPRCCSAAAASPK
jgi:hypothetical protein